MKRATLFKTMLMGAGFALIPATQAADNTYDYIVVGSGAGGGPLASSLAERGFSVLLLEAGDLKPEDMDYLQIPTMNLAASERPGLSWQYMVEHYTDPNRATLDSKRCPTLATCVDSSGQPLNGVFYPRGSTVGGSSAVNAMITVLPHDSDWNHIASITGDSSWSAPAMREYLIKLEDNHYGRTANSGHGTEGWLDVSHNALVVNNPGNALTITLPAEVQSSYAALLYGASVASGIGAYDYVGTIFPNTNVNRLRQTSIPPVQDPNNPDDPGLRQPPLPGEPMGLYQVPVAVDTTARRSGATARVLNTLAAQHPLTLQTQSLVTKVLFNDTGARPKAIGVQYLRGEHLYRADRNAVPGAAMPPAQAAYARKEVILSAGAFNTPQLLMLSGIGPSAKLTQHGIPVRVNLPGVGSNLQDRYEVPVIFKKRYRWSTTPMNFPALSMCSFDPEIPDNCYAQWLDYGLGIYTQPGAIASLIKKSAALDMQLNELADPGASVDPDLYVFAAGGTFKGYYPGYSQQAFDPDNQFSWVVLKGHSNNKGTVELRSADPRDTPRINFKYFGDPALGQSPSAEHQKDLDAVVKGIRLAREATRLASNYLGITSNGAYEEVWPGASVSTDAALRSFVMNESWGHHASCTAKIGASNDSMAVLDSRFRVRGVDRLRVVDASVFPRIPGFFPALAIYMVSEKAADAIAADYAVLQ